VKGLLFYGADWYFVSKPAELLLPVDGQGVMIYKTVCLYNLCSSLKLFQKVLPLRDPF
jgi:hypothetical protein